MEESEVAQFARGDLDIGNLASHAYDESEVGEIKIVRRVLARKIQAAGVSILPRLIAVAVKDVRIMQPEYRVHEHPGEDHGAEGQDQMRGEMRLRDVSVCTEKKPDGEQGDRGRNDHED